MKLTRRGRVVLAVAVVGFALAAFFGARSLNAVVLPAVVALVAAAVQVGTLSAPGLTRDVPPDGFPGETGTVTLTFETRSPFAGRVEDQLGRGLSGETVVETTVGAEPVRYEATYERRGEYPIGLVRITAQDVLGLVETDLVCPGQDYVLVYPRVHELSGWARRELQALYDVEHSQERDEFDRLREYDRGDALRDIHWRSSAKRDDLIVKEFAAESMTDAVSITAGAHAGYADEMAEATASIANALLEAGIPVTVSTPSGSVSAGGGNLTTVLEHLAVEGQGAPPDADVDVVVHAGHETLIRVGSDELTFEEMLREAEWRSRAPEREVTA